MHLRRKLNLIWVDAGHLEPIMQSTDESKYNEAWEALRTASGVIVPGGFGHRGTEGMMLATKFARENKTPFLGVCHCQDILFREGEVLMRLLGLLGFPDRHHSVRTRHLWHARGQFRGVRLHGQRLRGHLYA
jgi:CTP synthase (UTP-ammonia lyase)